jgi:hypothetical protein
MRPLFPLALPAVFAGPAQTGANAVPVTTGGLGSATISGYEVTEIAYALEGETAETVSFQFAPASARTVRGPARRSGRDARGRSHDARRRRRRLSS